MKMSDLRNITESNKEPSDPRLWKDVLRRAENKFDVYPSQNASAWAVQEYEKKGGGWKRNK